VDCSPVFLMFCRPAVPDPIAGAGLSGLLDKERWLYRVVAQEAFVPETYFDIQPCKA
jgi:hypothetical protein